MSGHTLKMVLEGEFTNQRITHTIICHESDTALCRSACTEGCEEYAYCSDSHIKPAGRCLAAESLDESILAEAYDGDTPLPLGDGMPVEIEWEGECYVWRAAANSSALG